MTKPLKYQYLIDSLKLEVPCPDNCSPIATQAFRWVKEDFSDGQSFLPNILYDKNRGAKLRKNDPTDHRTCGMCALSFFDSLESTANYTQALGGPSKVTKLLGYTHIAHGRLSEDEGIASKVDRHGHFMLFEFESVVLEPNFEVIQPI